MLPILVAMLMSCSPSPRPIDYAVEHCAFCKMTIVDRMYGSEAVTSKGKVYVFDAIECLIHFEEKNNNSEYAYELVTHFGFPGVLENASASAYLVSPALPSPMGANLTAFKSLEDARAAAIKYGGEVYEWSTLRDVIIKNPQAVSDEHSHLH